MTRKEIWRKADYDNRIPSWHKSAQRYKETQEERIRRILKTLDWEKLGKIGKRKIKKKDLILS